MGSSTEDVNSVSENASQEKEEINEGDSSQSVAEDLLSNLVEASMDRAELQTRHTEEDMGTRI